MKTMKKAVALALVIGTLGMTGSAMAASYRGAQIRRVPHLTRHIGRGYNAWKPGRSAAPIKRPKPQTWDKTQNHRRQPMPPIRKAPSRQWHGRFRMR